MPGTLYGPATTGYGSGNDIWLIIQGLQDQLDGFETDRSSWRAAVAAVATTNVALSGFSAVDGHTPTEAERILLVGQTDQRENGIWAAHSGAWTRPADFAPVTLASGAVVTVNGGTVNAGTQWVLASTLPVWVDTSAEVWSKVIASDPIEASARAAAVAALDAAALHKTGDETVGGVKSFTQKLQFRKRPWADAQHPDFGAVPGASAATNNVALQAWLDACRTEDLWGYLPPDASAYDISTTLNFTQKAGARLSGLGVGHPDSSGQRSRVRWTGAAAGTMLLLQGVRNSHIEGFLLDGNSSAGVGLDYDAVSGGSVSTENRFDSLSIAHVNGRGLRVGKSNFQTDQSEYYSCQFFANTIGVSIEDANAVWHDFYGCRWGANGTGITAVFAGTGGHFNLHGGRFLGSTAVDIATYATRSHTFTGVVSESSVKFLQGHSANARADAPVNLMGCGVQSIEAADRIGITWNTASILNIVGGHYASNHEDKSFKIAASNTRRANVIAVGASFDGNPFTEGTFNYNGLARTIGSNFVDNAATTDAGTIGGGIPFFTPASAWALTATVSSATSFGWSETVWVKVASGTALTAGANNFYMANNNVNGKCAVEIPSIHAVGGADAVLLGVAGSDNNGASAKTIKLNVRVSTNFTLTSDLIFAVTLRPEPISF
jgi:hypothetical protein